MLTLPARVDAAQAASIWKEAGASPPAVIDFAAVTEIDSAGLALVAELASRRRDIVLTNVPVSFANLCAAHRVDKELLG